MHTTPGPDVLNARVLKERSSEISLMLSLIYVDLKLKIKHNDWPIVALYFEFETFSI